MARGVTRGHEQLIKRDQDVEMAGEGEGLWRMEGGPGGSPNDATAGASLSCLVFSHISCWHA